MTSPSTEATAGTAGRTRRRGEALRTAILEAALEELRTTGYAGLSMDSVAAAAGTGKAALYRRWANRDELISDALSSVLPDPSDIELTDDPRTDLLALLRCIRDTIQLSYGNVFRVVRREVSAAQGMVHRLVDQQVMTPCHQLFLEVLRRGIEAGTLRPGVANDTVAKVGPAMLIHAVITAGPDVADGCLTEVVDEVLLPLTSAAAPRS